MATNYESQQHRYCIVRVDITKSNCDDVMDLFLLTFHADVPWAKTQMKLNKQFKHEFFKHLYIKEEKNLYKDITERWNERCYGF